MESVASVFKSSSIVPIKSRPSTDTYGEGKAFERIAQLIPLAQSVGDTTSATNLEQWLESNTAQNFVATNQQAIEDLGIYLYTTEVNAVQQYWFNVNGTNFPSGYPNDYTSMQWGGKSVYQTWFSSDPEMIRGINILPVTGSSLYLGQYPSYDQAFINQLIQQYGSDNWANWPDILWEFQAFYTRQARLTCSMQIRTTRRSKERTKRTRTVGCTICRRWAK